MSAHTLAVPFDVCLRQTENNVKMWSTPLALLAQCLKG